MAEMISALFLINAAIITSLKKKKKKEKRKLKKKRMLKTKQPEGTGPTHDPGVPKFRTTTFTFSG